MARVLLVEDDRWQADCYTLWLRQAGHDVRWVANAQTALDLVEGWLPQLIVLDMLLPHANGIQLLNQLRSYTDTQHVPVVICSAVELPVDIDFSAYGVVAQLHKAALKPNDMRKVVQTYAAT